MPLLVEPVELVVEELVTFVELDTFEEVDAFVPVAAVELVTELETPAAAVSSAGPHAHSPSATTATRYFSSALGFRKFMLTLLYREVDQESRATAMPTTD